MRKYRENTEKIQNNTTYTKKTGKGYFAPLPAYFVNVLTSTMRHQKAKKNHILRISNIVASPKKGDANSVIR